MDSDAEPVSRTERVVALLEDHVRTEMRAHLGSEGVDLPAAPVDRVAWGVAASVLYAFDVDWNPDWVQVGGVHSWEDSDNWFARCSVCLRDSPPSPIRANAEAWALHHEVSHE